MQTYARLAQEKAVAQNALRVRQAIAIVRQMPMVLIGNGATCVVGAMALRGSHSFMALLPLVIGIWLLLIPVAVSWLRLRRRAAPETVSRQRILKLTVHSGMIGLFWAACMLWYLPGTPAEVFGFLVTGCGFLAAGSAAILYVAPVACLMYAVPIMAASLYLTAQSGLPQALPLSLAFVLITTSIGWMLRANWKNFQDLLALSREKELRIQRDVLLMQERSEFLENFSHEIRNPLTGIIGFASLLPAFCQPFARRRPVLAARIEAVLQKYQWGR